MMTEFDRSPWELLNADLALYQFKARTSLLNLCDSPILMLHGPMTSHRTWDSLALALSREGCSSLYAMDIADVQMGGSLRQANKFLEQIIDWLSQRHPPDTPFVLIGHSTGGALARRYVLKAAEKTPVRVLFSLGSPHTRTHFSYQVYVPPAPEGGQETERGTNITTSLVTTPKISPEVFMVNLLGDAVGPLFDGTVQGVFLPEALNVVLNLGHAELKHHPAVLKEILAYLRGEYYRVQFFLENLLMRTPDQEDGLVGPFYFEVNGMRTPFEGIFEAQADHYYSFDLDSTPLATVAYPVTQTLASTVFRLKDLSRNRPTRRRLFAKLLDSLTLEGKSLHEMQDNEGSTLSLRVQCQRLPILLRRP
jgi:pimeloyl-ACP methyl ester carboxylesterase